jgi:hypothetical protein
MALVPRSRTRITCINAGHPSTRLGCMHLSDGCRPEIGAQCTVVVGLVTAVVPLCIACIVQVRLCAMLQTSPVFRFRWKSRSRFRMWVNKSRLMRLHM